MSQRKGLSSAGSNDLNEALRQASRINDFDKVKELIINGADVNTSYIGFTPLRWASMYGHKESIALLRENEARDDLHSAAARGDVEAMEELLVTGNADINAVNRGGETAVMWASYRGHDAIIKMLAKAKANVNGRDQHGFTALMEASQGGHTAAMQALIDARADVNAREPEDDQTALIMATHCARNEAVRLLIDSGAERPAGATGSPAGAPAAR